MSRKGKEERASQNAARSEEARRARQRAKLQKKLIRIAIIVVVVGGIAAVMFIPRKGSYTPGGSGDVIEGVQFYQNPTGHTDAPVTFPQVPPTGGIHHDAWLNCGIYSQPVDDAYAVHSMEHGAVWVTYDPKLSADQIATLRSYMPSTYVVMSPHEGLPAPVVASAWNRQLLLTGVDDPRLPRFFEEYWRSQLVPEPGALCTGGIDGPGRG